MVDARLDYCNAILYGTSKSNIMKLQRAQNSIARIVTGTRRSEHKTITNKIATHEDEMNDKYNDKLCTSNEVIQLNEWGDLKCLQKPAIVDWWRLIPKHCVH